MSSLALDLDRLPTPSLPSLDSLPSLHALPPLPSLDSLPPLPSRDSLPSLDSLPLDALPALVAALPVVARGTKLPKVPGWVPITALQAKIALMSVRGSIGILGWLFPNLAGRIFGIDTAKNPAAPYLARLFAARELALVAPLLTEDEAVQQRSLQVGMAVDSADAVAAVVAGASGKLPKRAAIMSGLTAVLAVILGWIASQDD